MTGDIGGNHLLFLYPIEEYVQGEITRGACLNQTFPRYADLLFQMESAVSDPAKERIRMAARIEQHVHYTALYKDAVNLIISQRYRSRGFSIHFAVFDDRAVSPLVTVRPGDRIIMAGLTFTDHTTERGPDEFPYPDPDHILDQIPRPRHLRVCGYHLWDCVERVASRAWDRGIDTLVDEDLTELLWGTIRRPSFRADTYPSINAREELDPIMFEEFIEARAEKPWMRQMR